jgi:CubicO group peptidase (beta-lactamase class C family)
MNTRTYIAVALIILTSTPLAATGYGQEDYGILSQKVDQIFARWNKPDSPGAAVVVLKDGLIIHKRGYGMANLKNGMPITSSTVFEIGSIAKQFTAMAIALLAAQEIVSLDDDIRRYVPEISDFGKPITIRKLVYHTSGLRNWEVLFKLTGYQGEKNSRQVLQMVSQQKELNFDPGEEYTYCNTGYLLLAEVVQRVTGQSFREWTKVNIFKPLNMTHTNFCDDPAGLAKNRALGYMPNRNGGFREIKYTWAVPGPTSLFTTAEDLAKWMKNFADRRLGGPVVMEQMLQRGMLNDGSRLDYACGLEIGEYRGLKRIYHQGGWSGFRSVLIFFPEQKFGVIILSNLGLGAFNPMPLANRITDIYLKKKLAPVQSPVKKTVKLDPKVYDAFIGKYILPLPYSSPGFVSIMKENDRLFGQIEGQTRQELLPESENSFWVKKENIHLIFLPDEIGKFNQFSTRIGSWKLPLPARRLQKIESEELKQFAGDFDSRELATTWTISVHKDQLWAKHAAQDDVRLFYTGANRFTGDKWWFQQIDFSQDDKGRINGFKLSAEDDLVKNLRFDKSFRRKSK